MGLGKRNPDNCDSTNYREHKMYNGNFPPAEYNPENAEDCRTDTRIRLNLHGFTKRAECKTADFHQLQSEWNAYYGHAHYQSGNEI